MANINFYHFSLASLGLFALLHFILVPKATSRVCLDRGPVSLAKATVLDFLSTFFLITTVVSVLLISLMLIVEHLGGTTASQVAATLDRLRSWRATLQTFSPVYSGALLLLLVAGLAIFSYRCGKIRMRKAIQTALELELQRLEAERQAGQWEDLPPTPEMEELYKIEESLDQALLELNQQLEAVTDQETRDQYLRTKEELNGKRQLVAAQIDMLDRARRLTIDPNPPDLQPPPPETFKERILTLFISRGLWATLRGGSRAVFLTGMLLLVPALTAVATGPLAGAIVQRELRLEHLYLELSAKAAEESWKQIQQDIELPTPPTELSAEDEEALDQLAQVYEFSHANATARVLGLTARTAALERPVQLHRYKVREHIIASVAQRAAATGVPMEVHAAAAPLEADNPEKELIALHEQLHTGRGPVTSEGHRLQEELRQIAEHSPERWAQLKQTLRSGWSAFQEPVTRAQLQAMLINRIFGAGLDAYAPEGELGRLVQEADAVLDHAARDRAYQIRSRRYLVALLHGNLVEAARVVAHPSPRPPYSQGDLVEMKSVAQRVPSADDAVEQLRRYPPSMARLAEAHADPIAARRLAEEMAAKLTPRGERPLATAIDALAGFDDFFPGQEGRERHAGPRPSPSTGTGTPSTGGKVARQRFAMSRSYTALRGSPRIGGVLIGREPEPDSPQLDFHDLRWESTPQGTRLLFHRADGKIIPLGPFSDELIHLALGYAADGRPVTVTMTTAAPLQELKIQLHPGLVDTALGCNAIELDRFVDSYGDYAGLGKAREEATRRVFDHLGLYQISWAVNLLTLADELPSELGQALSQQALAYLQDSESLEAAAAALTDPNTLIDAQHSPLPAKPEFFHRQIVDNIANCAGHGPGLKGFANCINARAKAQRLQFLVDRRLTWAAPPPEFEPWSGVREMSYHLDPELSFAQANAELKPFKFIVQLAFTTPPFLVSSEYPWYADDNPEIKFYSDPEPWEFPQLQERVTKAVATGIASAEEDRRVFETMRRFALLQRLFRVALDGHLGEDFPVDKLADLARDTSDGVQPGVRTLRWNVRPGLLELSLGFLLQDTSALEALQEAMGAAVRQCLGTIETALGSSLEEMQHTGQLSPEARLRLAKLSQERWDAGCNFEALGSDAQEPAAQQLVRRSIEISYARRIRTALGVARDDDLVLGTNGARACPVL